MKLKIIYNSKDDISFERIINGPRRGIGDSSIDILKMEKDQAGLSYYDYIKNIQNYNFLSTNDPTSTDKFLEIGLHLLQSSENTFLSFKSISVSPS